MGWERLGSGRIFPVSTTGPSGPTWQHATPARAVHAGVALLCAAGLVSSLHLGWTRDSHVPVGAGFGGGFTAGWDHMLNQLAYFTFVSGVLAGATSAVLACRPQIRSAIFHALRLAGVVCVLITGLVFNLLLRGDDVLRGAQLFNDTVLHLIVPVLVPLVWLILGPHGRIGGRVVVLSLLVPLGWLGVTLLRGPLLDWYPYEILDVPRMGYAGVGVYVGVIIAAYVVLALLLWGLDRLFCRRGSPRSLPQNRAESPM